MIRKMILILSAFLFTGCASSTLTSSTPTRTAVSNIPSPTLITPTINSQLARPSPSPNSTPQAAGVSTVTAQATQQQQALPSTPSDLGSKTYSSSNLNIAVNYPADWTVRDAGTSAIFTSPQGALIQLSIVETGGLPPQDFLNENQIPNTRCSLSNSTYGVKVRTCFDTISFSYDAEFILKTANGLERLLSLSTRDRAAISVFNGMVASVRLAQ